MTAAAKHSIAFRLGRALGALARFGMHDRNPTLRWVKRATVATIIVIFLANSISWILSTLITAISLMLGIYAFSKVNFAVDDVDFFKPDEHRGSIPMQGEYEHPDYYMYHKD